jgi:hypothetical protein
MWLLLLPQITNLTQALIAVFNFTLAYNPYPTPGQRALDARILATPCRCLCLHKH